MGRIIRFYTQFNFTKQLEMDIHALHNIVYLLRILFCRACIMRSTRINLTIVLNYWLSNNIHLFLDIHLSSNNDLDTSSTTCTSVHFWSWYLDTSSTILYKFSWCSIFKFIYVWVVSKVYCFCYKINIESDGLSERYKV